MLLFVQYAPPQRKKTENDHVCVVSLDLPFHELGGTSTAVTGKRLRTWLLQLRNSHCLFRESPLIDTVLDGYNKARHGAEVSASQLILLQMNAERESLLRGIPAL